jgi:subtilase family serine protease
MMKRLAGAAIALSLSLAACSGGVQQSLTPNQVAAQSNARAVCGEAPAPGYARCLSYVRTDIGGGNPRGYHGRYTMAGQRQGQNLVIGSPSGYGPPDLQSMYALTALSKSNGKGMTVGLVEGGDDPSLASDLAVYRSQYGLPACTIANGCLKIVSAGPGGTSAPDAEWSIETSLDVDMVSAICPNCHILVVETASVGGSALTTYLDAGENLAAADGADVISNSFGGSESGASDAAYNHPGIVITASSGDSGYSGGVEEPASYASVVAVGGTSTVRAANARGWSETAWSGAGSGCSAYVPKPSWQKDACANRNVADVSANADPNTGVAVYDSTPSEGGAGWEVVGGTSESSPIVASIFALAGNAATQNGASGLYANSAYLNDVAGGSTGTCTPPYECNAVAGYDGPTGLGTPNGIGAF